MFYPLPEDYKQFNKRRSAVYKKNQRLIKQWQSIPWWKFWQRPSFEEQQYIIIRNWQSFKIYPDHTGKS